MSVNNYPPCYSWERSFVRPFLKESIATFLGGLSVFLRTRCEHIANTKAHFIAFHLIFTFRVESYKMSMNQRNIIQNKITWNAKKFYSNRLTIWRSQVQAQAGLRFYYSDLCFGVGRCFLFNLARVNVMFMRENWQYYIKIRAKIFAVRFTWLLPKLNITQSTLLNITTFAAIYSNISHRYCIFAEIISLMEDKDFNRIKVVLGK